MEHQRAVGLAAAAVRRERPQLDLQAPAARLAVDMDQEEVSRQVARYNLLAIPVVEKDNTLVGIITVDDVVDVIREEATEDMLKMAGAAEGELFAGDETRALKSEKAMDALRARFGQTAVLTGRALKGPARRPD